MLPRPLRPTQTATGALLLLLALGGAALVSCDESSAFRPPPGPDGAAPLTGNPGGSGMGGDNGQGPTGGGDNGQGPTGGAPIEMPLTIRVVSYQDELFERTISYQPTSRVRAVRSNGRTVTDELVVERGQLSSSALPPEPAMWFLVRPERDPNTFPTVSQADTTRSDIELKMVPQSLIDAMLNQLAAPSVVDEAAAQLLVRVLDSDGAPLSGVSLAAPTSEGILYLDGGVWTDFSSLTDSSGYIFVYNLPGAPFPGREVTIPLSGSTESAIEARLVTGSLTVVQPSVVRRLGGDGGF